MPKALFSYENLFVVN